MKKNKRQKAFLLCHCAFVALWMSLLFSSLVFKGSSKLIGWPDWSHYTLTENRALAPMPDFRSIPVKTWGSSTEAWYNDNFAWRSCLVKFYRHVHFSWLKTSVGREVPGLDGWVFRRGGDWAELDDYLGGFELTEAELDDWMEFFRGRKQWAEAHGAVYLQVVSSVKAQIQPEKLFPFIRNHKGVSSREQLQKRLVGSSVEQSVLFSHERLNQAVAKQPVFYPTDHHLNAFGLYLLYDLIQDRLGNWFPDIDAVPFYDNPPEAVLNGTQAGCYERDGLLWVVAPGSYQVEDPLTTLASTRPYPLHSVALEQPGGNYSLVMANDSTLRYALSSWRMRQNGNVRFPLGSRFKKIVSLLFLRFSTGRLDYVVSEEVPDVILEQFAESKLCLGVRGLGVTMQRAAAFESGTAIRAPVPGNTLVLPRCVLEDVTDESGKIKSVRYGETELRMEVELLNKQKVVDTATILPGVRRAVFFKPVAFGDGGFNVRLKGGRCRSSAIQLRQVSDRTEK